MKLKDICDHLSVWEEWKNNYNHFVPQFIEEASKGGDWSTWKPEVFNEFFNRSSGQCVSSLRQGYFTKSEQEEIKRNWHELAPLFQTIALNQNNFNLDEYWKIKRIIRKFTKLDRRAATNRLIAALQPQMLCTIVNEGKIWSLFIMLKNHVTNFDLEWKANWFENSYQILKFFKNELNQDNGFEILTLPWQVFEEYNPHNAIESNDMSETDIDLDEYLNLLQYKKQIILQGPPGTGKTRLAKEIAKELIGENFNISALSQYFKVGQKINSSSGIESYYDILDVYSDRIIIKNENAKENRDISLDVIKKTIYQIKNGQLDTTRVNYAYESALAKYLLNEIELHNNNDQFKLIQFHPSYTYEDFVRGIVAESKGDKITYKNVNKTLGNFAEAALKNYLDSKKIPELVSKEIWVEQQYQKFKDDIEAQLETVTGVVIKEKTVPKIIAVEEIALRVNRYDNENDKVLLKDSDIVNGYISLYLTEQPVKVKNNATLSRSARSGMYYLYQNLIEKFKEYLDKNTLHFQPEGNVQKHELKNYVLIIDEINRANLSSVLGELVYALEYRGESVDSIYEVDNSNKLILPPNLYIIGTMNTADRSVGHIDYAIRRRFAFVDVLPKNLKSELKEDFKDDIFEKISKLFVKDFDLNTDYDYNEIDRSDCLSSEFDPKDVWIGHSYFIQQYEKDNKGEDDKTKPIDFNMRIQYEIKPILREYLKDGIFIADKTIDGKAIKEYIENL